MAPTRQLALIDIFLLLVGLWLSLKAICILLRGPNATRLKGPPPPQQKLDLWFFPFHQHQGSLSRIQAVGRTIWRHLLHSYHHLFLNYFLFNHRTDEDDDLQSQGDTTYIFQNIIWICSQ
jgi:hypothetical protein